MLGRSARPDEGDDRMQGSVLAHVVAYPDDFILNRGHAAEARVDVRRPRLRLHSGNKSANSSPPMRPTISDVSGQAIEAGQGRSRTCRSGQTVSRHSVLARIDVCCPRRGPFRADAHVVSVNYVRRSQRTDNSMQATWLHLDRRLPLAAPPARRRLRALRCPQA